MARRPAFPPAAMLNPLLLWSTLGVQTAEMLLASGFVIGKRVGSMARHGAKPNAAERREMHRMGSEKLLAATRSGLAVAEKMQAAQLQLLTRGVQPWWTTAGTLAALGDAALKPVHAAATANARRLSKKPAGRKSGR